MIVLSSVHPLKIDEKPSKRMVQFGEMFVSTPLIKILRMSLVKLMPIPPDGHDITPYLGQDFNEVDVLNKKYFDLITIALPKTILHQFNLTDEWLKLIMVAVVFNAIIDLEKNPGFIDDQPFVFVAGKKNIASKLHDFEGREILALLIPFHSSKQQYHQWIDDHWGEVEKAMDHQLARSIPFMDYLQNHAYGMEIDKLKKENNSYKEIAKILSDKYPLDDRLCDYGQIKMIHKRYLDKQTEFDYGLGALLSSVG